MTSAAQRFNKLPYEKEAKYCLEFLTQFEDKSIPQHPLHGYKKYKIELVKTIFNV